MNKQEQVMTGLWNLFQKRVWLNEFKMKANFKGYHPSDIHCVEYIGKNADTNVTQLAESFYMTRSAISKLTKRLTEKGLIESYRRPDNKKEVCFRLTEEGKAINKAHEELHREFEDRDKVVFEQISSGQFSSMLRFVEKYTQHLDMEIEKLGVDITAGYIDKL